jgi:hypothetical protein
VRTLLKNFGGIGMVLATYYLLEVCMYLHLEPEKIPARLEIFTYIPTYVFVCSCFDFGARAAVKKLQRKPNTISTAK